MLCYRLVDFENKAAALQAEISKLEEEKTAATEKDQLSVVKISELSLKLDEISQVLKWQPLQTFCKTYCIQFQDLTKKTDELEKLRAEKEFLEEKLLVIAELEAELAKEKLEKASFSEENMKLTQALSGVEEDLKCSKSAFDLSQKELEALNVRLGKALEEMQTLQNSNQELDKNLQESDLKLKAEIDASQQLKQLLEQKKYLRY